MLCASAGEAPRVRCTPWHYPDQLDRCSPPAPPAPARSAAPSRPPSPATATRRPARLPPLPEQNEVVRRVKANVKLADTIEARVAAATRRAEKLTQVILAKAFRGELVPTEAELARQKGRDYGPPSVLLKRIRAERANAPASRRTVRGASGGAVEVGRWRAG
jgi:hypothetical protein